MRIGHWLSRTHKIVCDGCGEDIFNQIEGVILKNKEYISFLGESTYWKNNKVRSNWGWRRYHVCDAKCLGKVSEEQKIVYKEEVKQRKIDSIKM